MSDSIIRLHIDQKLLIKKLGQIKAWIFDWDGVFNDGHKNDQLLNTFCERDSMATNLLRYAHYLRFKVQPYCAIVTGSTNLTPSIFANREHFHHVVSGSLYKRDVVEYLLNQWGILPEECGFFFDDVLDLNVCEIVGLRIQVAYSSSIHFNNYVDEKNLVDISCFAGGGNQAIRQVVEYLLHLTGQLTQAFDGRIHVNESYRQYFDQRQNIVTQKISRKKLLQI